jgi:hypothetical protein
MTATRILTALAQHRARCTTDAWGRLVVRTPRPLPVWLDALLQLHWADVAAVVAEQQCKSY